MERQLKILNNYIDDAREYLLKYVKEDDDIKKEKIAKNFMNEILQFLDHSITGFPSFNINLKNEYFPRDKLILEINEYEKFLKSYKINNKNIKIPKKIYSFLLFCYKINKENNNSLFYVGGSFKHRDSLSFNDGGNGKVSGKYTTSSSNNLVKYDKEGNVIIGGNLFKFSKESKDIVLKNITIQEPEGITYIEHLDYNITIKGKYIILKGKKLVFNDFAKDCIKIISDIFHYYERFY